MCMVLVWTMERDQVSSIVKYKSGALAEYPELKKDPSLVYS